MLLFSPFISQPDGADCEIADVTGGKKHR